MPNNRFPIFNVSLTTAQYLVIQRALFLLLAKHPNEEEVASTYLLFEAAPEDVKR